MSVIVVGASGATGRLLVEQLLSRGLKVKIIVRDPAKLPENLRNDRDLTIIQANLLDLSDSELVKHVRGCAAIASCLGHNLTFKGIFGPPRDLVTRAVRRLCNAVRTNRPETPVKFILMNTTGNRNRDVDERQSLPEKFVIGLLRLVLPPQVDNENAAEYLRSEIGLANPAIAWAAVRPDSLIDAARVSEYELCESPVRSPIFDAGKTSRINVGHFMAELITDDAIWEKWRGRMPVIYNAQ